ncbi:LOG family protein [Thermocoleostomius sinensis]|uniref:LOG family protein n=1 Tax=Thermocoleostomius sinensis A174 TaxID=2016057 RepID=A0A9E8ZAL3_9CYAN|nr:LOG family protein [Thermocoleostomius sinensis]WAL59287.1 LOG family protein [Thermocoleostomius sinensis A174]
MSFSSSSSSLESFQAEVAQLLSQLPNMEHGPLIQQALTTLVRMAEVEADRLDWKILNASLQDMERAFRVFYPYRHVRKITIFGSARTAPADPTYQMAVEFARAVVEMGFMVMTGGGPGIMQAGNEGAGADKSFGLNIQLPFEQGSNPFIEGDPKLIDFKYFFTRKLFFLRETDALALFPGGFGTQDEAFECLTLMQTGKTALLPLVLIDKPGSDYWQSWDAHLRHNLLKTGLISPDDLYLYTITDRVDVACEEIASFYRVFHSSRYVGEYLILRLKTELTPADIEYLNQNYRDLLIDGHIQQTKTLPEEHHSKTDDLFRLVLHFNQRDHGRLYQMIREINQVGCKKPETTHPEQK